MVESIRSVGLLQPPLVRPVGKGYELVFGEKRWRACSKIGEKMLVYVEELSDADAHLRTITENAQRSDLTPLEMADQIQTLLKDGMTMEQVADRLGRDVKTVARRARLVNLTDNWRKAIVDEKTQFARWTGAMIELVARYDQSVQEAILKDFVDGWVPVDMHDLEEYLSRLSREMKTAPWNLKDASLFDKAGACSECQKRTSCQTNLFESVHSKGKEVDQCIDPECWSEKHRLYVERRERELRETYPTLILLNNSNVSSLNSEWDLYKSSIRSWEVSECKKTDDGATPALIVDGPGFGQLKWVRANGSASEKAIGGAAKTIEERRARLEIRRRCRVIDKLLSALIAEAKKPDLLLRVPPNKILVAVSLFGVINEVAFDVGDQSDPEGAGQTDCDFSADEWDRLDRFTGLNFDRSTEECAWELGRGLAAVLVKRFSNQKKHLASNLGESRQLKACCALFGIDYDQLAAEVACEIKEPRSWAKATPTAEGESASPEMVPAKRTKKAAK
jgi:ParB/RepB/Spo0J family partition protein